MIDLISYCQEDGTSPFIEWLNNLNDKAIDACRIKLERLRLLGHLLRRPEADYLRDGIYELRAKAHGVNHRILYFFHGRTAVVISHGIVKQQANVPWREINLAINRQKEFTSNPSRHSQTLKLPL